MRYRSKSTESYLVSAQAGWSILFASLLVAVIVGGAFRVFLGPEKIRYWVIDGVKQANPGLKFQVEKAQLSLSKGLLPRFAVILNDVEISSDDECLYSPQIKFDQLDIPIRFLSMITGKLRLGEIHGGQVELSFLSDGKLCGRGSQQEILPQLQVPPLIAIDKKLSATVPPVQADDETWDSAGTLSVEVLDFRFKNNVHFLLKNFLLKRSISPAPRLDLESELAFPADVSFGEGLPDLSLTASVDEKFIKVKTTGRWREGILNADIVADRTLKVAEVSASLKDLPVKKLVEHLHNMKILKLELEPKLVWLSCNVKTKARWDEFQLSPIDISNCKLEGDIGEIALEHTSYVVGSSDFPLINVNVRSLDVDRLNSFLRLNHPSSSLGKLGKFTGTMTLSSLEDIRAEGELEGLELLFSNQGRRSSQELSSIKGKLTFRDGRIAGNIESIQPKDGNFVGTGTFNFDKEINSGVAQLRIDQMSFSPDVQDIMLSGKMSPLAIYGKASWENRRLKDLSAELGVSRIDGSLINLNNLKISVGLEASQLVYRVKTDRIGIRRDTTAFNFLKPLLLDHEFQGDIMDVKGVSGTFYQGEGDTLNWRKVQAHLDNKLNFQTTGEWDRTSHLSGWIQVDYPGLKGVQWDLVGTRDEPKVVPNSKWLRELAKKNHPKDKTSTAAQIENLGKKVLEGAKRLIPTFEETAKMQKKQIQDKKGKEE